MARQKGLLKYKGTLDDLTFYQSQDGNMVRQKGSLDAARIKKDPAFIRTRENMAEFSSFTKSGKLLREAIRPLLLSASDNRVISRLNSVLTAIKNQDSISARGLRNVGVGITVPSAKALLKGFNFNKRSLLESIVYQPYIVNTLTGVITINGIQPINNIIAPPGATHFTLKGAWARVDFVNGVYDVQYTNLVNLKIDNIITNVVLTPAAVPAGAGTDLFLLEIEFFQEVNLVQYMLNNGGYNALTIAEVG